MAEWDGGTCPYFARYYELHGFDPEALRKDCCGDDRWRGRLCEYHQGYEDGFDGALAATLDGHRCEPVE